MTLGILGQGIRPSIRLVTPAYLFIFLEKTGQGTHTVEYTGLTTATPPTETNTQLGGDRAYEGPIRFSDSGPSSPQEAPRVYDNEPELSYLHM